MSTRTVKAEEIPTKSVCASGRAMPVRAEGIAALPADAVWVRFVVPVKTTNPLNGSGGTTRGGRMAAARRAKIVREDARFATIVAMRSVYVRLPLSITLTRVSTGTLDAHDGLPASLKRIVDGIAEALGIDDGDTTRVRWLYAQRKGKRGEHAVEVQIAECRESP